MIKRNAADIMIAGGSEAAVCKLGIAGFCSARSLSTHFNDNPSKASRPWDKGRDGFVLGEGAGIVVLEELRHAQKRGAEILAEISGYGATGDAYHLTSPAPGGEGAARAMKMALNDANINPEDVDLVIFCTISSDYFFPGGAVQIQEKLGMKNIGAFDLRAACSGFVYGLSVADQFIRTGAHETILLIGAEAQSVALEFDNDHRDMAVLFGDGAGALILQSSDDGCWVLSRHLHSDGKHLQDLCLPAPGSKYKPFMSKKLIDEGLHTPYMNGREVFKNAVTRFPEVIHEALTYNGLAMDDIALVIPHQANLRITQAVAKRLGVEMDKVSSNIHKYGNTTASTITIPIFIITRWISNYNN